MADLTRKSIWRFPPDLKSVTPPEPPTADNTSSMVRRAVEPKPVKSRSVKSRHDEEDEEDDEEFDF